MAELRPKYHKGSNQNGSKSVTVSAETYKLLKSKADELDVTIKSLLAVLIEENIGTLDPDTTSERIGG